jgi:DNA repair photolyase
MSVSVPVHGPVRGRGARSNRTARFDPLEREDVDDGWSAEERPAHRIEDSLTPLRTRSIISKNASPDIGFTRSINPYVGCSHGCVYCYARPSHAYMSLSPGVDFETKLFFKPDAPDLVAEAFSRRGYAPERIHLGANTDPYQPAERTLQITRRLLEVFDRFNHPVSITTKGALIVRDIDILGSMARRGLVKTYISVTTLDRRLARDMEPRAPTPERRLSAVGQLAAAGVPTGVGFAPVIPGLNDHELEPVLERAAAMGATEAMFTVLRLPREVRDLFDEWLHAERPDRARRVMSLVRQMRGGRDYDADFASRMTGTGPIADLIAQRFGLACKRLGLNQERVLLRTDLFRGDADSLQGDLFAPRL